MVNPETVKELAVTAEREVPADRGRNLALDAIDSAYQTHVATLFNVLAGSAGDGDGEFAAAAKRAASGLTRGKRTRDAMRALLGKAAPDGN